MIFRFATKRGTNGYRKYIIIDTDRKQYATDPAKWFCREDYIEVSAADRRKLIEQAERENLTRIDYI